MEIPANRLKTARERAGFKTAREAVTGFGWTASTYFSHENGTRGIPVKVAMRYAAAFQVSPSWILTGEKKDILAINQIPVLGEVAAGLWYEVDGDQQGESSGAAPIPVNPAYPPESQFALVVRGTSLNKIANDGDILACLDIATSGVSVENGDLVIIERSRFDGQMIERTAKRFRRDGGVITLSGESTDKQFQEPLIIRSVEDHESIRIWAKVIWILRKP